MSWINEHRRVWGIVILALLLLASMGPWGFDRIHVPAQYPCSAPFIRLEGDFCGLPLSGMWMLSILPGEFISLAVGTVAGRIAFTDLGRTFLGIVLVLFALLPVISALLWIFPGHHQHQSKFHLAAWGLAAVFIVRLLPLTLEFRPGQLWGLWLYTGLVSSVLILAVVALAIRGRSSQARWSVDRQTRRLSREGPKYPPNNGMNPTFSSLRSSQAGYASRYAARSSPNRYLKIRPTEWRSL